MRVPDSVRMGFIKREMNATSTRMQRYEQEIASGLRILRPSDDPEGALRASYLRSNLSRITQYADTANNAAMWLKTEDSALSDVQDSLTLLRQYALEANRPLSDEARETITSKIATVVGTLLQAANSNDGTRFVFAGHQTTGAPFHGTQPADITYTGDNGTRTIAIGDGTNMVLNHTGAFLFNIDGTADAGMPSTFDTIQQLTDAVRVGDMDGITNTLTVLDKQAARVLSTRAETGIKLQQVTLATEQMDQANLVMTDLLSQTETCDVTEVLVHLKEQENLFQAVSYIASTVNRGGLLDWLR